MCALEETSDVVTGVRDKDLIGVWVPARLSDLFLVRSIRGFM
jgi:hypothetical protein